MENQCGEILVHTVWLAFADAQQRQLSMARKARVNQDIFVKSIGDRMGGLLWEKLEQHPLIL